MTEVIGLTGYGQSGKDTAAGFLTEFGYVRLAFADILRESLYNLNPIGDHARESCREGWGRVQTIVDDDGWEYAKSQYPEVRALLQRFGTDVGRALYGENFWVARVTEQIEEGGKYVVTDVRFPNEVAAVRGQGGLVYRITRPGFGPINSHISDTGIDDLKVDGTILNDGDLEQFREAVLLATGLK